MAHYAYLDENNIVIDVIVGKDETELINGLDTETYYGAVRTSYNGKIRKNYAGIGYSYDAIRDAFIAPKPDCHIDLITLDEQTCQWVCTGIHKGPFDE
jgi:hypothetical protein